MGLNDSQSPSARDADESTMHNLEGMLDQLKQAQRRWRHAFHGRHSKRMGRRSFGPILLLAGLIRRTALVAHDGLLVLLGLHAFSPPFFCCFGFAQAEAL